MTQQARKMALGFIVILLFCGLVADYLTVHHIAQKNHQTKTDVPKSVPTSVIMANLSKKLNVSYTHLQKTSVDQTNTIGYQIPGETFQTILSTSGGDLTYRDSRLTTETNTFSYYASALSFVGKILHADGYALLPVSATNSQGGLLSKVSFYENQKNLCQITAYTSLDITCVTRSELYKTGLLSRTLINIYHQAVPTNEVTSLMSPILRSSLTPGYQLAVFDVFGSGGETSLNFYKQGTGSWQLVNLGWYNDPHEDGSVTPNCEDFESLSTVQAAYKGQVCYDSVTRTMSTVN